MTGRVVTVTGRDGRRVKAIEIDGEVMTAEKLRGWIEQADAASSGERVWVIGEGVTISESEIAYAARTAELEREILAMYGAEDADGVVGVEEHQAVKAYFRANGISSPVEEDYVAAWRATSDPLPAVKPGAPLLVKDPDAAVDSWVLSEARSRRLMLDENGVLPQSTYDTLVKEARVALKRPA